MDTSEPEALSQRSSMDQSMMSGSGLSSRSSIEPLDFRSHLKRISGAFGSPHSAGARAEAFGATLQLDARLQQAAISSLQEVGRP